MGELFVHVVDDDAAVRDSLSLLLRLREYRVRAFASAEEFLDAVDASWCGCVVADIRMPGRSGLELQEELARRGLGLPVVIVTAHGDVASARAAFKSEAVDFLEKPFEAEAVVAAVEAALSRERSRIDSAAAARERESRLAALTDREREVMGLLMRGLHNKDIARELGISPRTVEIHKARVMQKCGARNIAELIRLSTGDMA